MDHQHCFICNEQFKEHEFNECDLCYQVICESCIGDCYDNLCVCEMCDNVMCDNVIDTKPIACK